MAAYRRGMTWKVTWGLIACTPGSAPGPTLGNEYRRNLSFYMPYGITECYIPSGSTDIPACTPAEAGTQFSDPGGMQGWVDLGGGYIPI